MGKRDVSCGQFKGLASSERRVEAVEAILWSLALTPFLVQFEHMPILGSYGRDRNFICLLIEPAGWSR